MVVSPLSLSLWYDFIHLSHDLEKGGLMHLQKVSTQVSLRRQALVETGCCIWISWLFFNSQMVENIFDDEFNIILFKGPEYM